jgi:hypothetical protein
MRQVKTSRWLTIAAVCSLLLAAGCAPVVEETAKPEAKPEKQIPEAKSKEVAAIALKFSPGDLTTYKVITEAERRIKWEGPVPDEPAFKGGNNYDRREMTFTQEIQSVDDKGNAIAKITVKELKYSSMVKESAAFEFDSIKPKDPNHPLAKLIGQSYTLKIAPTGEVIEVIDTKDAETAVRKGSVPPRIALKLLSPETIKERHGNIVLPDTDKDKLHIGDKWSNTKTFSFGMMGSESYERIYTLNQIEDLDNQQVAVIDMSTIPAPETSEDQTIDLLKRSDNIKTYTGKLELNLTTGKVMKYHETLLQEWITAFPGEEQEENQGPVVLTMSATLLYSLEKID